MRNFQSRFVVLKAIPTKLPFTVGSVTQHGSHLVEQNTQDAVGLWIDESSIIAVVCDGCAGASPLGTNLISFNETGAQLLSVLTVQAIKRFLKSGVIPGQDMVIKLEKELKKKYKSLLSLLIGNDSFMSEHILFELLMSTIVGVVINSDKWCVFHGGDGMVIYNGKIHNLNGIPPDGHSGEYIANTILQKGYNYSDNTLHLLQEGDSQSLDHILIGSDGVIDLVNMQDSLLSDLICQIDQRTIPYESGYDPFFFREFRKRVSTPLTTGKTQKDEHDDRSFVLIRRLISDSNEFLKETEKIKEIISDEHDKLLKKPIVIESQGICDSSLDISSENNTLEDVVASQKSELDLEYPANYALQSKLNIKEEIITGLDIDKIVNNELNDMRFEEKDLREFL